MAFDYTNYYRLQYIESNGTQYINPNVTISSDFVDQTTCVITSTASGRYQGAWNFGQRWGCDNGKIAGFGYPTDVDVGDYNFIEFHAKSDNTYSLSVDGIEKISGGQRSTSSQPYFLFATAQNSTTVAQYSQLSMRMYSCKLWDSGTLIRDFVPAQRKSDGEVGLYDVLNNTFYEHQGTNPFTSGSIIWSVNLSVSPSGSGTVNGGGTKIDGSTVSISASANTGYAFAGWYNGATLVSTNNPYSFTIHDNVSLTAKFVVPYNITLTYDSTLGSASYSWSGSNIVLTATPNSSGQFKGWYINSVPLSAQNPYTYAPTGDVTIEARFEQVYTITDSVSGNGTISITRGADKNDVTITAIPDANYHFVKYVVNGTDNTTTPLVLHLTQNTTITAVFEEDETYHISLSSSFPYGSFYVSANDVYPNTNVTIWARPFPDYVFTRWSDGETSNPRQILVNSNITLIAEYQRLSDTNGIYQYRCFIKDQMDLEAYPKAFLRVDTFDIRTDLLTNATSSITTLEMLSDVDEGDVLVLYDPKGQTLYTGVINSIEDKTIECSQMQSFYKGLWIYDTAPSSYLEEEIASLLQDYADGKMKGSSYVDGLVAQRLGGITIDYTGSTAVSLPSTYEANSDSTEYETLDMEEFIYELYQKYGIEFSFEINVAGTNYVHIHVPSYTKLKVGSNMFAISNMLPITEIEEMNRLIIYASDYTYRTTYVATKTGIVEEPSTTANRFNITNTEVVFSDDPVEDLVAANLPQTMYNHKLEFDLLIKNFIYEFGDFNLGGELDIYYGDEYYNSVLTGYEISKMSNQNITDVHFICGIVRTKLTQLLSLGKV